MKSSVKIDIAWLKKLSVIFPMPKAIRYSAGLRMKQILAPVQSSMLNLSCIASLFLVGSLCSCQSNDCSLMEMPYTDGILHEPMDEKKWKCICRLAKRLDYKEETLESVARRFGAGCRGTVLCSGEYYVGKISYQYFTEKGDCEYLIFEFNKKGHLVNVIERLEIGGAHIPLIQ